MNDFNYQKKRSATDTVYVNRKCGYYRSESEYCADLTRALIMDIENGYCPKLETWYRDFNSLTFSEPTQFALYSVCVNLFNLSERRFEVLKSKYSLSNVVSSLHGLLQKNKETSATEQESAPSRPAPTESAPVQATPTEPAPIEAAPVEPAPTEPVPAQVAPAQTVPTSFLNPVQMLTDRNRVLQTEIGRLHARIEALNDEKNRAQQEAAAVRREAQEAYDRFRQVELGQMLEEKWAQYREERIAELNEEIARHKEEAFAQSTHAAEERYRTLVKENLSDYLQVEREERNRAHEQLSRSRESIAAGISAARIAACDESSRMQREMKEYMDHYMVNFAANMDKWRRSLYNIQLEGFAEWYADFCGFVDNFDARLYSNPDNPNFDAIVKIGKGLKVRRNALENALPSMGLQSFYPAVGGSFDYAYHECAEGDAQDGDRITAVTKPGIYLVASDSDLTQVLVKAEVKTEVN